MASAAQIALLSTAKDKTSACKAIADWVKTKPEFKLFQFDPEHKVWAPDLKANDGETQYYTYLFEQLSSFADRGSDVLIFVDRFDVSEAAFHRWSGWSALIAMLVVSLPEARWAFIDATAFDETKPVHVRVRDLIRTQFCPQALDRPSGTQVFDALGLRNAINQLNDIETVESLAAQTTPVSVNLPAFKPLAFVLEDEAEFRGTQSLAAYAWGFRICSISTWLEAEYYAGVGGICTDATDAPYRLALSLEDLAISYGDRQPDFMENPDERRHALPALAKPGLVRRFVSISRVPENGVLKPTGDFYRLRDDLEFPEELAQAVAAADVALDRPSVERHGAQSKCIAIAEAVIARINRCFRDDSPLQVKVRCAVAAGDIADLLRGRSPMLAAEALYLRHIAEVSVVSNGVGSRTRLGISSRIAEIEKELNLIKGNFPKGGGRKNFVANAKVRIVARIETILGARSLMWDADQANREARKLRGSLTASSIWHSDLWPPFKLGALAWNGYLTFASLNFLTAVFWAFFLSAMALFAAHGVYTWPGLGSATDLAFRSFVSIDWPSLPDRDCHLVWVGHGVTLVGVVHFGILLNLLYNFWMARR